jgi:hypothetical protein
VPTCVFGVDYLAGHCDGVMRNRPISLADGTDA